MKPIVEKKDFEQGEKKNIFTQSSNPFFSLTNNQEKKDEPANQGSKITIFSPEKK